jgi:hypothetical protein
MSEPEFVYVVACGEYEGRSTLCVFRTAELAQAWIDEQDDSFISCGWEEFPLDEGFPQAAFPFRSSWDIPTP